MEREKIKNEIRITDEMLKNPGVYIIDAPTGMGKSQAIKELKCRTLVVDPRCGLVDQQTEDTFKDNKNITVRTIQSLAYMDDPQAYLNRFDVVVADEAHDLISGADYDNKMIQTARIILHAPKLICLTATDIGLERLFALLGRKAIVHKYADNVTQTLAGECFGFIPNMETAIDVIDKKLKKSEKVLFFTDNTADIEKIQQFYLYDEKVLPVISKSNPKYKRLCNDREDEINKLIKSKQFPDRVQVVCATRCMDVGLNIMNQEENDETKEPRVTTVICNIYELACMRQCLGRLRLNRKKGEQVDFYCVLPKSQALTKRKAKTEKLLAQFEQYQNDREKYIALREGIKLDASEIVYHTYENGQMVEKIDYCRWVYAEYLMATIYKTPTVTAWKLLVEQMLGCQGVPMKPIKQQHDEQWQREQTMELKKQMAGKVMGKKEKDMLKYIYHNEVAGPKAFNRIWKERGWNEFYIDGDKEEKATYITDPKSGQRKRKRGRNGWMFNETDENKG